MPSELKSDTARVNGAKSRGPKSPETRAISAQNALKHGFTSRHTTLLECENPAEFAQTQAEHIATYRPADDEQQSLIDEMVSARWRIRRIRVAESVLIDLEMRRNHLEVEKQFPDPEPVVHVAEAMRTLINHSRSISLISRYESRLARLHDRAYRTLRELQRQARRDPDHQSTPLTPSPEATPSEPACKNDETNPAPAGSPPQPSLQNRPQTHEFTSALSPARLSRRRSQGARTIARRAVHKLLRRS